MALDKNTQGGTKPDSTAHNQSPNLGLDVAELAALLAQCQDPSGNGHDDAQLEELLKKLSAADGVAKGVEERLDGIIENLDTLLAALQDEPADKQHPEACTLDKSNNTKQS